MDQPKPEEFISLFGEGAAELPGNDQPDNFYGLSDEPTPRSSSLANDVRDNEENPAKRSPTGRKPAGNETPVEGDKETVRKMTGIESAKDRAQITSSTAMSIVHIALLKNVMDFGSENDNYYNYRIGFILTALILQVIAGFIALYIALLRSYYTKYRDDFLNDCFKICCPWRCRKTKKKHTNRRAAHVSMTTSAKLMDQECEDRGSCCPFECATQSYYNFEYEILDMYDVVTENVIRSEIDAASSASEIAWFTKRAASLKKKLEDYKSTTDPDKSAAKLASINQEIKVTLEKKDQLSKLKQVAEGYFAQGVAMEQHVEKIYQQRVLKRVTFWQNLLNMVFYVVFILNAIIAGLGLADPNIPVAEGGSVESATQGASATSS